MGWADLLAAPSEITLPWVGGRSVYSRDRSWTVPGALPPEHGWHRFRVDGSQRAVFLGPGEPDFSYPEGQPAVRGYLIGDRMVPDGVAVRPDIFKVFEQTEPVSLVEPGLDRFARALAVRDRAKRLIYIQQEFPLGPEPQVIEAWQEGREDLSGIPGVTPALDLAFRWMLWQRMLLEERRRALAEAERKAEEERLLQEMIEEEEREIQAALAEAARWREHQVEQHVQTREQLTRFRAAMQRGRVRRGIARFDFETAAAAALALSGASLLDSRDGRNAGEKIVQFRLMEHRFECVVHAASLRIIDAGICLTDHHTGERGDDRFTLESLPGVIQQALREHRLHVYRHREDWED